MENYKSRLLAQKEALQSDIDEMIEGIKNQEIVLEGLKQRKALAFRELRTIEKKLQKLA